MGFRLNLFSSEIFMNHFERQLFKFNMKFINTIKFWIRYVDDVIYIFIHKLIFLRNLIQLTNILNHKLQKEINNSLNFFDLQSLKLKINISTYSS